MIIPLWLRLCEYVIHSPLQKVGLMHQKDVFCMLEEAASAVWALFVYSLITGSLEFLQLVYTANLITVLMCISNFNASPTEIFFLDKCHVISLCVLFFREKPVVSM